MPIQPLPPASIRSLSSSQVITDPLSLIKELIENSLDASATAITIDVTPNLLDSITIRDNGTGILPSDRTLVARRHATSKIRSYSDLASCNTLGFRGEALASAAELSEHLQITTRVEGEMMAEAWDVPRCVGGGGDETARRRKVSAPTGTAITIKGFLKPLPVRREVAAKQSTVNAKTLKTLIGRYYLANPKCRFALRGAGQIIYPPAKSVVDAARHVLGPAEWNLTERAEMQCLFPRNMTKSAATGTHYVYVNSRPVVCTRGTMKLVLKAVRKCIGKEVPFWLNIKIPRDSYDPNIEPAKDDVMFHDSEKVLRVVWEVLSDIYGEVTMHEECKEKGKEPEWTSQRKMLPAVEQRKAPEEGSTADQETESNGQKRSSNDIQQEDADHRTRMVLENDLGTSNSTILNTTSDVEVELELAFDDEEEMLATQLLEEATAAQNISEVPVSSEGSPENQADRTVPPADPPQDLRNCLQVTLMGPATPPPSSPVHRTTSNCWGTNMAFEIDEDNVPSLDDDALEPLPEVDEDAEREQVRKDVRLSNPWTAAKAAASMTPNRHAQNSPVGAPIPQTGGSASSQPGTTRASSMMAAPLHTQQRAALLSLQTLRRSSPEAAVIRTPKSFSVNSSPAASSTPPRHPPTPSASAPFRPPVDMSSMASGAAEQRTPKKQRKRPLQRDLPTPERSSSPTKRQRVGPMDGFVTAATVMRNPGITQFFTPVNKPPPPRTLLEDHNDGNDDDLYASPVSRHHGVALARRRRSVAPRHPPMLLQDPEIPPPPPPPPPESIIPRPSTRTRSLGLPPPVPAPPRDEQVLPLTKNIAVTTGDLRTAQALFRCCEEAAVYAWGRGRAEGFYDIGDDVGEVLRKWMERLGVGDDDEVRGWKDGGVSVEGWAVIEVITTV